MTLTENERLYQNDKIQLAAIGAVGYWLAQGGELPSGAVLAGSALVVAGVAAALATGKIEALLPDPERVWLVVLNAKTDEPVSVWKLTPDQWAEMEVKHGPLFPHEHAQEQAYEAYAYDPDANVAVGTWRRSVPGSELLGRFDAEDVLDVVGELRDELEPEARRGERIRQSLPAVAREIRYDAMESQDAALDPSRAVSPDPRSPDEILMDQLPADLLPGRLSNDDLRDLLEPAEAGEDDWQGEGMGLIVEDDGEALEPAQPASMNGGSDE
jgi:hypothetical protein